MAQGIRAADQARLTNSDEAMTAYLGAMDPRTVWLDPHGALEAIYRAADTILAGLSHVTTCKQGCGHCCYIDVGCTQLEAEYIARRTNHPMRSPLRPTGQHTTACPFLSPQNDCSIHPYRPFNCRVFASVDNPALCAQGPDTPHKGIGNASQAYGSEGLFNLSMRLMVINPDHTQAALSSDIRDWFGATEREPQWTNK